MPGISKQELIDSLNGITIAQGWDAIIACDKNGIDTIFGQQFIQKSANGNTLVTAEEDIPANHQPADNHPYIHASALTLGQPRLSFENANIDFANAIATLDFLSGRFFTLSELQTAPLTVAEYNNVLPGSQYRLVMTLNLSSNQGPVGARLDLSVDLGQGGNASVNLVSNNQAQLAIGNALVQRLAAGGEAERQYVLASLGATSPGSALNPVFVTLRTQPSPVAPPAGDGAMVLFVQTESGSGGLLPTGSSGFPYLVPDDIDTDGNALYSSSLTLRSRTVFDALLRPAYLAQTGGSVSLSTRLLDNGSTDPASFLSADGGSVSGGTLHEDWQFQAGAPADSTIDVCVKTGSTPSCDTGILPVSIPIQGLGVIPSSRAVTTQWPAQYAQPLVQIRTAATQEVTSQPITIGYPASLQSLVRVDPASNDASIVNQSTAIGIAPGPFPWAPEIAVEPYQGILDADLANAVLEAMNLMASVPVPGIGPFSLDSLQFPAQTSLQLDDAALPGDLVLFGRTAPVATALQVTPTQATVVAGGMFTFNANATGVTWSVKNGDGGTPLGHVDGGVYLAPTAEQMGTASRQEIVTATLADGQSASAVVILSARTVLLNPGFIYALSDEAPLPFRATSISGEIVQWSGDRVQVDGTDPFLAWYTPPASTEMTTFCELGQITATTDSGATITASVLVVRTGVFPAFVVGGGPWDPASPDESVVTGGLVPLAAGGTLQLKAIINGQDLAASVIWSIAGDNGAMGRIDSTGLYTAPPAATTDCVIALAVHNDEDFGYAVIPLAPTPA